MAPLRDLPKKGNIQRADINRDGSGRGTRIGQTTGKNHIIRFSLRVFEHIHRHRQAGVVGMGARGRAIIHAHLQRVLAELIADDVREAVQSRRKISRQTTPELLVQYVASTFVLVLNWWVESNSALRPKEVDGLFRALTLPTLSASLGGAQA